MTPDEHDALRKALADAHRGDAGKTPAFQQVWAAARGEIEGRPSAVGWLLACASLAAALGLAGWLFARMGPPPAPLPTGTRWVGPTDFLLQTPDLVTLRTVPRLLPSSTSPVQRGNP